MKKITTANSYTDVELLALWREADAVVSVSGQSYTNAIGTFTSANLDQIRASIMFYESRISGDSGLSINIASIKRRIR